MMLRTWFPLLFSLALGLAVGVGETNAQGLQSLFRKKADREVDGVLTEKAGAAQSEVHPEIIQSDVRSRF